MISTPGGDFDLLRGIVTWIPGIREEFDACHLFVEVRVAQR